MESRDFNDSNDFTAKLSSEWLETNGLGGYASSTLCGANTRRYHGLLVAALKPPVSRHVLLSKCEETITVGVERYERGTNQYPGVIHPCGHRFLKEFRQEPFPISVFQLGPYLLEKTVWMPHGHDAVVIEYELIRSSPEPTTDDCPIDLELRPLLAFREHHSLCRENHALISDVHVEEGRFSLQLYDGLPRLYINHSGGTFETLGDWYRQFVYEREKERVLDHVEDLFNPGVLRMELIPGRKSVLIASLENLSHAQVLGLRVQELERRKRIRASAAGDDSFTADLAMAADQFIVRRGTNHTVIAGYPWFVDWGRDTMISLCGLTLTTGRFDIARSILLEFSQHVSEGMIPNRFPDDDQPPAFNTIDATLWYFEAIANYERFSGDTALVREELLQTLCNIIDWHIRGTRFGIRMDTDDLLVSGPEGGQLTWMDAQIGDWVVTPRGGKAVEIQALWYNALCIMRDLASRYGESERSLALAQLVDNCRSAFAEQFWNESSQCLYDVINCNGSDASLRPNQVLALGLTHVAFSPEKARLILRVVERELLTPVGLRTLSPRDPRYCGRYFGDQRSRDSVYHQGTVWPWLLGSFIRGYLYAYDGDVDAIRKCRGILDTFRARVEGFGLVPEVFDGDSPHIPGGCISQAWSVAEILRSTVELDRLEVVASSSASLSRVGAAK